jgi:hypothetical protein
LRTTGTTLALHDHRTYHFYGAHLAHSTEIARMPSVLVVACRLLMILGRSSETGEKP